MDGGAIAASPLGRAGLGALAERFPPALPEQIRLDAALAILADEPGPRPGADGVAAVSRDQLNRATRP